MHASCYCCNSSTIEGKRFKKYQSRIVVLGLYTNTSELTIDLAIDYSKRRAIEKTH